MSSFIKIGWVVLPLWVVENRPFPLLWPLAYTTVCTTVQAVITVANGEMCLKMMSMRMRLMIKQVAVMIRK